MGTHVLDDAFVSIDGLDVSDHVKSVRLTMTRDDIDDTNMGDSTHVHVAGMKEWGLEVDLAQDFAGSSVDSKLWTVYDAGAAVAVIVRADATAAQSATNPSYTGNAVLLNYPPIGGNVGDLHTTTAQFSAAGDLARNT